MSRPDTPSSVETLQGELMGQDTGDLEAVVCVQIASIEKVVTQSKNVKRSFVRHLRLTSRLIEVAAAEIRQRIDLGGDGSGGG